MASYDLDKTVLTLNEHPWTVRDAVRGVQIFGSIGSGKSSGSGAFIARKYLGLKWGGLVLCAKPDEAQAWIKYARECGKTEKDIIHFCEGSPYQFNPLNYETERKTKGGGLTFNLTELFMSIFKMGQRIAGSDSEETERFWENSLKRLINRVIELIKLSGEKMTVKNMVDIVGSMPLGISAIVEIRQKRTMPKHLSEKEQEKAKNEWHKFLDENLCIKCIEKAREHLTNDKIDDFMLVYNYFFRDFPLLDEKAQSTIKEMFLGFAEPFLTGILKKHFSSETNIVPEDSFDGKLIILDFPVMEYLVSGVYAQCLFKYLWQQSVQRRKIDDNTKPTFLWIDESQYFINEYDVMFQTTARSSMACTVLLTQNISNYYMQMGGKHVKAKVDSMLGNLGTLIFHNNSDAETNEWASRLIGKEKQKMENFSASGKAGGVNNQTSASLNEQYLPQVQPKYFTTLSNGGMLNNYKVDAVVFSTGRTWKDKNYIQTFFEQKI